MASLEPLLTLLSFGEPSAPDPDRVPVRELRIGSGDRGARQMIRHMRELARKALRQPLTIRAAERIIPPDVPTADKVFFLRDWLAQNWVFQPDPVGMELLRTPDFLLTEMGHGEPGRGDCDDVATLAAALGMAAGIPARFVLVSFGPGLPFTHVYCELLTACNGWVELDVTRPAQVPEGITVDRIEAHEV